MSKRGRRASIIASAVLGTGLAIGAATTGVVLANQPLDITYYANNGTPEITAQIKKGDNASLPTPTREGYNFVGWYLDTGLTEQVTSTTKLKQNSKLYAGWELANYEVAAAGAVETQLETSGLKSIGKYAFANSNISSLNLPNTVTIIDEAAFANCANLTSVTIPESVNTIGERAFLNCVNLSTLTINHTINRISAGAFAFCKSLSEVTFNAAVNYIDEGAFAFCNNLTTITFNAAANNVGALAFAQTNLQTVKVPSLATWCSMGFSSADANPLTSSTTLQVNGTAFSLSGRLEIPKSVTKINSYTFANCTGLNMVIIPETVTTIGASAFSGAFGNVAIHCVAESKPSGWNANWNNYDNINKLSVKWFSIEALSWERIKEVSAAGNAASKFTVGDEKTVKLTNGTELVMQIADFNHDLAVNGSTIGITFITKGTLTDS